ncbi:hypothetical protein L3X38_000232 (mitochondrion) [Prunus dulcis]|uniref:Uncharacterized protein n=1 Tax=Prunus dulcis TaxID=3755 RepID=A0AAD4UTB2_PRUDU|nr:hypothetical protein L3X38_000232 [Prunus dulcis]
MSKGPTTMGEGVGAAPAPAEVAHPAPDQNERAALLRDIHTLIREQLREYCARGKGGLAHSPEMLELYSSSAKAIMSYDLDIPAETDTETPRRWERANQKFHFEFRTSTSCCSWCFTISIGNERRSGGTCGTTYWITPVRHEAADAESAPMPLAMPCLVPRHGGDSVARHEHRAKGRLSNSSEPPYLTTT